MSFQKKNYKIEDFSKTEDQIFSETFKYFLDNLSFLEKKRTKDYYLL